MKNSQVSNCQFIPPPERLHGRESTLAAFHAPVRDFMNNTLSNQSQIKQYYAANIKLNRTINQYLSHTLHICQPTYNTHLLCCRGQKMLFNILLYYKTVPENAKLNIY